VKQVIVRIPDEVHRKYKKRLIDLDTSMQTDISNHIKEMSAETITVQQDTDK